MKFITIIVLIGFLFIPFEQTLSFSAADSDSMIAGLPSRPLNDQEERGDDDFTEDYSEESDEFDSDTDSDDKPSSDNSERYEDWYEPDPAYQ